MTNKEAKEALKKFGRLEIDGTLIVETIKNGAYTGRYNIVRDGELVNDFPLTLTQALSYILAK